MKYGNLTKRRFENLKYINLILRKKFYSLFEIFLSLYLVINNVF